MLLVLLVLGQIVFELSKVHDAADGRDCCGGDFDEVEAVLLGGTQSVLDFHDTELFPGGRYDHAHLTRANALIDPNLIELYGDFQVRPLAVEHRAICVVLASPSLLPVFTPGWQRLQPSPALATCAEGDAHFCVHPVRDLRVNLLCGKGYFHPPTNVTCECSR